MHHSVRRQGGEIAARWRLRTAAGAWWLSLARVMIHDGRAPRRSLGSLDGPAGLRSSVAR